MWTCETCGEKLDPTFDQCWRCAALRDLTPKEDAQAAAQDAYELGELHEVDEAAVRVLSPAEEVAERAALTARAAEIARYEGGHLDARTASLARIHRGYSLYRARSARPRTGAASPALRQLDRLWSAWLWVSGGTLGLFLAIFFKGREVFALFGEIPIYGLVAGGLFSIWFGYYVAGKEIANAGGRGEAT